MSANVLGSLWGVQESLVGRHYQSSKVLVSGASLADQGKGIDAARVLVHQRKRLAGRQPALLKVSVPINESNCKLGSNAAVIKFNRED